MQSPSRTSAAALAALLGLGTAANVALASAPLTVSASVTFADEPAKPVLVNGVPTLPHRFWSCVDKVTLNFSAPPSLVSLAGGVRLYNPQNERYRRAYTLSRQVSTTTYEFTAEPRSCNDIQPLDHVLVGARVAGLDGASIGRDVAIPIHYPASHD
jgi:hypothetical protein